VLVEDGPATVLVYPERACLVVPATSNKANATPATTAGAIAQTPTIEASMLVEVCVATASEHLDGADVVVLGPADKLVIAVGSTCEERTATTVI